MFKHRLVADNVIEILKLANSLIFSYFGTDMCCIKVNFAC